MKNAIYSELEAIEVIIKCTERCNINCSYCYYFNGNNKEYEQYPKVVSPETVDQICRFLSEAADELNLKAIQIDFHGGEPMMMKKDQFESMCNKLVDALQDKVRLSFAIQTNATLVDDDWIEIFSKFNIGVGVSLDGPKHINDMYRLDHKGRSTYEKTANGVKQLQAAVAAEKIEPISVLSVIDPKYNATEMYNHFIHEMKFWGADFLLPDFTKETFDYQDIPAYTEFLKELFDVWKADFNTNRIRIIDSFLGHFSESDSGYAFSTGKAKAVAFVIQSNGDLGPDDTLRSTGAWKNVNPRPNIYQHSLVEYLHHPAILYLEEAAHKIPDECSECCWKNVCGGGGILAHQYSEKDNSCNHASVYCDSLQEFYAYLTSFLIDNGLNIEKVESILFEEKVEA
ncbi:radical SAM protein [Pleionea sediminis]|uniref:radical SAM protein n=1 Tax=Pleionea sediminis TaxID=2569479 RepID=UPI001187157F|nr:radical SAM protein [Pleionea sediminis]